MGTETKIWQAFGREEIETIIQGNIRAVDEKMGQMLELFLTSGYYLRRQYREEMYKEAGFEKFEDYVREVYGKSKSWASRMMKINEQYSLDGDSPKIDPKYKGYGISQLQEMLYLSEEQKEQVTPEMTVKEIRAVRQEEEEPLSFFGLKKTVRPEGSLLTAPGCGDGKHTCFLCFRECKIRQEERRCRTATCGNPFPCGMMGKKPEIETGLYRDECQHLHPELARVHAGDQEPSPCCLECAHKTCYSRCDIATKRDEEERRKEQEELRKQQKKSGDPKPAREEDQSQEGKKGTGRCESAAEEPEAGPRELQSKRPEEARPAVATSQPEEKADAEEDSPDEIELSVQVTPRMVLEEAKKKLVRVSGSLQRGEGTPGVYRKAEDYCRSPGSVCLRPGNRGGYRRRGE